MLWHSFHRRRASFPDTVAALGDGRCWLWPPRLGVEEHTLLELWASRSQAWATVLGDTLVGNPVIAVFMAPSTNSGSTHMCGEASKGPQHQLLESPQMFWSSQLRFGHRGTETTFKFQLHRIHKHSKMPHVPCHEAVGWLVTQHQVTGA